MTDKPRDAIMGALAFFDPVHPNRDALIRRAALSDPVLTERKLNKALIKLAVTGEVVVYEKGYECLIKKAEAQ